MFRHFLLSMIDARDFSRDNTYNLVKRVAWYLSRLLALIYDVEFPGNTHARIYEYHYPSRF